MGLPIFKDDNKNFMLMQTKWAGQLNPLLANPATNSLILQDVILKSGSNVVNHRLGRKLQGWKITRQRSSGSVYDAQDANQMSDLTLVLISSSDVSVDLEVF